jgi:hypothetical protein
VSLLPLVLPLPLLLLLLASFLWVTGQQGWPLLSPRMLQLRPPQLQVPLLAALQCCQ